MGKKSSLMAMKLAAISLALAGAELALRPLSGGFIGTPYIIGTPYNQRKARQHARQSGIHPANPKRR